MNALDLGLLMEIGLLTLLGVRWGFLRLVLPAFIGVAVWWLLRFQPAVAHWLRMSFDLEGGAAQVLAYAIIILGTILLSAAAAAGLRFFFTITLTAWLDRLAGAAVGAAYGIVFAVLALYVLQGIGGPAIQELLDGSVLADPLRDLWRTVFQELNRRLPLH